MKAHFKYLTLISWTLLTISCSAQKLCTPTIELKEKYKDLGIEEYKSNYEIYHNDYEFTALNLLSNNTDEYDLFYANLMVDLIKNKLMLNNATTEIKSLLRVGSPPLIVMVLAPDSLI